MVTATSHAMPEADRGRPPRSTWIRLTLLLLGGVVLLYVTFAITFAQVMARRDPAHAYAIWPSSVAAAKMVEADLLAAASANDPRQVTAIGKRATLLLRRDPVNVVAARVAGLAATAAGEQARGARLLAYAEGLSRRDLPTQLALIEEAVAREDIATALRHYDTGLRTGDNADQLLLPVLVAASRDPAIAARLAPMLARRPPWRLRFVYVLITAQPWAPTFVPLMRAARLDVNNPLERDFLSRAATGLVATNRLGDAAALYRQATGRAPAAVIRNGSFTGEDRIAPFDWIITDEPGLGGVKGVVGGGAEGVAVPGALSLTADPGRTGPVARQLLLLPPGPHRLHFVVGNVAEADRSSVLLSCNGTDTPIASVRFPQTANGRSRAVDVAASVSAGCAGQWLTVQAGTDIDASDARDTPWISGMSIER